MTPPRASVAFEARGIPSEGGIHVDHGNAR